MKINLNWLKQLFSLKGEESIPVKRADPKLRINKNYQEICPNNCPIIEQTADGVEIGTCCFYIGEEKICPRHGKI